MPTYMQMSVQMNMRKLHAPNLNWVKSSASSINHGGGQKFTIQPPSDATKNVSFSAKH